MTTIDYSRIKTVQNVSESDDVTSPPHVYFGPKDPNTGKMLKEPPFTYAKYPKFLYQVNKDGIEATLVNTAADEASLEGKWIANLADVGIYTAPSFEQTQEMKAKKK